MEPASAFLSFQFLGIPPKGELSDWLDRGSYRELKYAICERFCDRWLLVEPSPDGAG